MGPILAGFTITGMTGMAYDPVGHQTYIILKVSGVSGRVLATIDLNTGVCTQIGNLGDKFATITFRSDGQLFGVTGNGATVPETMYTIDKTNANKTLAIALGNGADGEILTYNHDDGMFYHWSGNGTIVYEKFIATPPYTPVVNIPIIGTTHGETFGALYLNNGNFLVSNISSTFEHVGTNGQYSNNFGSNPDNLRGLVMLPTFSMAQDTVCANDTVTWLLKNASMARDTAIFFWGDGTSSTVFPAASATHTYATTGTHVSYAVLKNDTVGSDTMKTHTVKVNALPVVALTPGTDTTLCAVDSLNLQGASGGTLQWFMNGAPIPGANSSTYTTTMNGWYNQVKTNLNGCSDSAAVGVMVAFGSIQIVDLGADSTLCDGDSICLMANNAPDVTYLWSTGATTNSQCFTSSGNYSLTATDSVGCTATDAVNLTFLLAPDLNVAIDSSNCPTFVFHSNDPNGTSWLWNFGDGNTGTGATVTHTYTANGAYAGIVTASNQCFSDTSSGTINVNCIMGLHASLGNGITISPNPSNGTFILNAQLPAAANLSYQVTDLQGRTLMDWKSEDLCTRWTERVVVSQAPGIYFMTVTSGTARSVYRVVIQ